MALSLVLLLLALYVPDPCRGEAAILRLVYRNAVDVLPLVEGLLSRDGRAAVDTHSNSLVVVDGPESIRRIEVFVADLDRPGKQARIRLKLVEATTDRDRSLSLGGTASGENWRVSGGRTTGRPGVDVRIGQRGVEHQERSEYAIQVTSGNWAYIAVGKEVPYTQRWIDLSRRHARVSETVVIRRIETGMDVRPTLMGDRADVEIVPRISRQAGDHRDVIRFVEASTRVTVGLGQWLEIGGADTSQNEVVRAVLESSSGSKQGALSMVLMVEEVK